MSTILRLSRERDSKQGQGNYSNSKKAINRVDECYSRFTAQVQRYMHPSRFRPSLGLRRKYSCLRFKNKKA